MDIINVNNDIKHKNKTAVALGNFDGVHIGHQKLINIMKEEAEKSGLKSSLLLFKKHTRFITKKNNSITLLTDNEQKLSLLKKLGIDIVYTIDFNEKLMGLSGEDFVRKILVEKLNTKLVVVGFDYKFGYKASCDSKCLNELGKKYGLKVLVVDPVYKNGEIVSSTIVRDLIKNGQILKANKLLGRPYVIKGKVVEGSKRGRKLGFPTANLKISEIFTIPKNGVYETRTIFKGKEYLSVTNIGNNPTFNEEKVKIENHILDFNENLYGNEIKIIFKNFIRKEIKHNSQEKLKAQIIKDIKFVRKNY